jgi:hypothetical protein
MSTTWFLIPIVLIMWHGWRIAYPRVRIRWEFKKQDCWIGVYWEPGSSYTHLWVCLLPMLPIHFWWPHREKPPFPGAANENDREPAL